MKHEPDFGSMVIGMPCDTRVAFFAVTPSSLNVVFVFGTRWKVRNYVETMDYTKTKMV